MLRSLSLSASLPDQFDPALAEAIDVDELLRTSRIRGGRARSDVDDDCGTDIAGDGPRPDGFGVLLAWAGRQRRSRWKLRRGDNVAY